MQAFLHLELPSPTTIVRDTGHHGGSIITSCSRQLNFSDFSHWGNEEETLTTLHHDLHRTCSERFEPYSSAEQRHIEPSPSHTFQSHRQPTGNLKSPKFPKSIAPPPSPPSDGRCQLRNRGNDRRVNATPPRESPDATMQGRRRSQGTEKAESRIPQSHRRYTYPNAIERSVQCFQWQHTGPSNGSILNSSQQIKEL